MSDLLEVGDGMTRAVIGVELAESILGDLKVLLSFYRLATPYKVIWDRVEIVPDDERIFRLNLGDFVSRDSWGKYFPAAKLETEILIPFGKVYQSAQAGIRLWL